MCLFRKCDETIIETKDYPSVIDRLRESVSEPFTLKAISPCDLMHERVTTIRCNACGRIRIDQRTV